MEFSCVVPYDENLEPLATEEESKEQEERMAQLEKWKFLHRTTSNFFLNVTLMSSACF